MRVLPVCLLLQDKKVPISWFGVRELYWGCSLMFAILYGWEHAAGAKPNEEQMVLILDILYMKYFR